MLTVWISCVACTAGASRHFGRQLMLLIPSAAGLCLILPLIRTLDLLVIRHRCPVDGTKNLFFTFPGKACILRRPNLYCQPFCQCIEILSGTHAQAHDTHTLARKLLHIHMHTVHRNSVAEVIFQCVLNLFKKYYTPIRVILHLDLGCDSRFQSRSRG